MDEALSRLTRLPDDLKFIREREGIGMTQLGHAFGVTRVAVWQWEKGKRTPEEPLILLGILTWADRLRNSTS
jgi:DNA-binding transcriptional regulator YiaG